MKQTSVSLPGMSSKSQHASQTSVPVWVVDPQIPGENLPPVGRSLFDFVILQKKDNELVYDIPYPFDRLIKKIERELAPDDSGQPLIKQVLIPLGRSLQRSAGAPEFFKFPRLVAAVDAQPRMHDAYSGMLLKDRLYMGYHEKAQIIEVISYNESAGRFEFQVVKDYRPGGRPQVFYANRTICTTCHQNSAPIFARQLWDETNANPIIAALLKNEKDNFYGANVNRGVDIPYAVDNATDRANLFSAYQKLWTQGCGADRSKSAAACRANLFMFMLQYRLSGEQYFDMQGAQYRKEFIPLFEKNWRAQWPKGLYIPDPDIPNRNPVLAAQNTSLVSDDELPDRVNAKQISQVFMDNLLDQVNIPAQFEPLNPRAPMEVWSASRPNDVNRVITGLSQFIADADIHKLDDYLFSRGKQLERHRYSSICNFIPKKQRARIVRVEFKCAPDQIESGFAMQGQVDFTTKATSGKILHFTVDAQPSPQGMEIYLNKMQQPGEPASFAALRNKQRVRLANGNAVEKIDLDIEVKKLLSRLRGADTVSARATLSMMNDFILARNAINEIVIASSQHTLDAFAPKPFRRSAVMRALFERLGMPQQQWCCDDTEGMPQAVADTASKDAITHLTRREPPGTARRVKPFYEYCAACHRTPDHFPPNFLQGDALKVRENLSHCATRILFRLNMWQLAQEQQPKTPMPPENALHGLNTNTEQWINSSALESLKKYVADDLAARGQEVSLKNLLTGRYEDLPSCLPNAG